MSNPIAEAAARQKQSEGFAKRLDELKKLCVGRRRRARGAEVPAAAARCVAVDWVQLAR